MFDEIKRYYLIIDDKLKDCTILLKDKDNDELQYKLYFNHEFKSLKIYRFVECKYELVRLERYPKDKFWLYLLRLIRLKL